MAETVNLTMSNLKDGDHIAIYEANDDGSIKCEDRHKNGEVVDMPILIWRTQMSGSGDMTTDVKLIAEQNVVIRLRNREYVPLQHSIYLPQEDDLAITFDRIVI